MRARLAIAGLSAKKLSSGNAGVALVSVSALSPRSRTQSGSPTGATAASPSSAPRSTMVRKRGSRPSASATRGRCAQANSTPEASRSSRRLGAWKTLVMASPSLEFGRHEEQCQRLRPALGAAHGLPRLGGGEGTEHGIDHGVRLAAVVADEAGGLVGDVEALGQTVDPGGAVVGETLRRRWPPQRFAEQVLRVDEAAHVTDLQAAGAHCRH